MSEEIFNDFCSEASFDTPFDEEIAFKTVISPSEGGREYRYSKWQYPKRRWKIQADARNQTEVNNIWNFYRRMRGTYDTFRFENPNDSPVENDVFATGDGVGTQFYLGGSFSIPTGDCLLISGSVSVQTGDGTTFANFSAYSGDYTFNKIVTNSPLPLNRVMRASYRFRYRGRFANDSLSKRAFAYKLWQSEIEITQVI